MKDNNYAKLLASFAILLTVAICSQSYGAYIREEAYIYLKTNVLGTTLQSYFADGSAELLPPSSKVECLDTTIYSPTFTSWLFSIDFNHYCNWAHELNLYFIDCTNLSNYYYTVVQWWVQSPAMEFIELANFNNPDVAWDGQNGGRYEYPEPDPHLKAILIAAGPADRHPDDDIIHYCMPICFFVCLQQWYVMLKCLGYSEIEILMGHNQVLNDPTEYPNIWWKDPDPDEDSIRFGFSGFDLDGDDIDDFTPFVDLIPTSANIFSALRTFSQNLSPLDRVVFYFGSHGSRGYIRTWNQTISANAFYDSLGYLNDAAELYVFLEACHSGSMFTGNRLTGGRDYSNWPNTHLVAAADPNQTNVWEYFVTNSLSTQLTWQFVSNVLGYYPWVGDQYEDGIFCSIEPWRKGRPYDYEDHNGGFFFDHWELYDRNQDEMHSLREALEGAWAKIPFWSDVINPADSEQVGGRRYHYFINQCI